MCDPVSLAIAGGTAAANHRSQRSLAKAQTAQSNRTAALQAAEFDKRMGLVNQSDARIDQLVRDQYREVSGLEDETFSWMLNNDRAGFDEQMGLNARGFDVTQTIAGKAFSDQMDAFGDLITAQRAARLEKQAFTEAEEARQKVYQDRADLMAGALPGEIGFDAQQIAFGDALDRRTDFAAGNIGPRSTSPVPAGDPTVAAMFDNALTRGHGEAAASARSGANLAAYGDALTASDRKLADFGDDIAVMTRQAATSRAPLSLEQAIADLVSDNAAEAYDFKVDTLGNIADQRIGAETRYTGQQADTLGDYRVASGNTRERYATNFGDALTEFYDRNFQSEGTYTDRLIGSSNNYEGKIVNLGNYRMSAMQPNTLLGDLLDVAGTAYGAYRRAQPPSSKSSTGRTKPR